MKKLRYLTIALAGATALTTAAYAQTTVTTTTATTSTTPAEVVETVADNTPIVLSGTVQSTQDDKFVLDYGDGIITVEMDGWEWAGGEGSYLKPGDNVTVSGNIDNDLFSGRELEADTVYLHNYYTYYYTEGSTSYPYDFYDYGEAVSMEDGSYATLTGTIAGQQGDEFTINTMGSTMKVDVSDMSDNPFDAEGYLRLKPGDRVRVYGEMDEDFFSGRELEADRIVLLRQATITTGSTAVIE